MTQKPKVLIFGEINSDTDNFREFSKKFDYAVSLPLLSYF